MSLNSNLITQNPSPDYAYNKHSQEESINNLESLLEYIAILFEEGNYFKAT